MSLKNKNMGGWRNGSASASRAEGWVFESLTPQPSQINPPLFSSSVFACTTHNPILMSQREQCNFVKGTTERIVYVTCPDDEVAKKLARGWDGKIDESSELLLMIKTLDKHLGEITNYVNKHHGYDVPEVLSVKVDGGNGPYLKWINESVKQ
ncbi:1313_t:CDS:2 [Cetraspora pellucida]|uniref:1313_t:CDS:1 n=1 Tax=Cetraspora pellucida TaxID=1433469 RepID=A0ACA9K8R2_9GLOM|nr:1313_t:CDS:2 [Cetraspora pellucida]